MADQKDRIAFLKDALKNLATAVRDVSGGLIDLEEIIKRLKGETTQLSKNADKASKSMSKTAKETKKATAELKKNETQTKKNTTANKGFFSTFAKNVKTIASFYAGFLALNLVVKGLQELFVNSTKRAIAFEKALADLQAVAGLTSSEVDRLEKVVFKVAGSTSLTTLEVVDLQKQLAKLGSSAREIENLTRPIALLSQALGEDAGGVAATLKKTLNQFQKTSEEAESFANILTGAVNETALSLTDLGTALSYVGPLGAQMGISFEETASLLGILADNGFKASKAGTGLRTFFIAAAKDGRPFNDFLEDIASRNLSAAESFELFGRTGASQALVLSNNIKTYKELSVELSDNTRLLKANAIQMSTNQGQLDLLSSAYDKVSTKIGTFFIKSRILIGVMQILDPQTAALAESYGVLSTDSDVLNEKIDDLANSMRNFGEASDSVNTSNLSQALGIILESGKFSDEQIRLFEKSISYWRNLGKSELEAVNSIISTQSGFVKRIALTTREILKVAEASAKQLDNEAVSIKANDEIVKDYTQSVLNLQTAASEGNDISSDKITLYNSLNREINQNISAQNLVIKKGIEASESERKGFLVTEKRIELLKELLTVLNVLSSDETKLEKERKARIAKEKSDFKNQVKDYIERIKETEKAIGDLRVDVSESAFPTQIELLNGLFGEADDIIADATKRFGPESKIVKELIALLKSTAEEISTQLPKEAEQPINLVSKGLFGDGVDLAKKDLPDIQKPIDVIAETFYDKVKEAFEGLDWGEVIVESVATASEAIDSFNDVSLENTKNRLEQELDAIRSRYEVEEDILKSQLNNQLITESQYRQKQKELRKAQIRDENDIDKKIFDSEQKRDKQNASVDYLQAIASIIPTLIAYDNTADPISVLTKAAITGALATASYGAELGAIGQRKFFPKKFAEGGVVNGPSHNQGGVPFSVQGQGGYEMEGGEYIINKRATSMHRDLLEKINKSGRTSPKVGNFKYAQGGMVNAPVNESVDYLKAIAEATTSTAIGVSKPVRSFITDKDLRSNSNERRIRDRNDRI